MGCGWWLDMCSLDVIGASWVERLAFVRRHMLLSHFLHWAIGVAFMIHVAVLVAVLREVVRPEVLWFLRNPEEAIEHPLRDLIDEPVPKHVRRITLCLILYLPLTLVLVYLPLTAARMLAPDGMFPLHISLDTISDVPSEVVLLHVSLPFLMEHFRPRNSFKKMLECWIGKTKKNKCFFLRADSPLASLSSLSSLSLSERLHTKLGHGVSIMIHTYPRRFFSCLYTTRRYCGHVALITQ
jgi:E3 ubiquitin-protein ligase DOA10